jgi:hypothetical protein
MITITLVGILGVLLVLVLVKLAQKPADAVPAAAKTMPQVDLANLKPSDARAGDSISIAGAGDNMSDLDFSADHSARMEAGARQWIEVSGPYRERRVILRAACGEDDEDAAVHNDPRKLTLEDVGLSEDDLAQMDERQNTADNFEFDGKSWGYRLSREVTARRDGQGQPAGFYYWEFREQDGNRLLAIRKAEGEPFAVTLYTGVNPGDVTIFRGSRA